MLLGLRVVRGPDWKLGPRDGGEGYLGTVVKDNGDYTCIVVWDMGRVTKCRIGQQGKYDLRVLEYTASGVEEYIGCSQCEQLIYGMRWQCAQCPVWCLCSQCYFNDHHSTQHPFKRFDNPESKGYGMRQRSLSTKLEAHGMFPGAIVRRGPDWEYQDQDGGPGNTGEIIGLQSFLPKCHTKDAVKVRWMNGMTNIYRVGHGGKVDLTCETDTAGLYYYRDHLPLVGKLDKTKTEVKQSLNPEVSDVKESESRLSKRFLQGIFKVNAELEDSKAENSNTANAETTQTEVNMSITPELSDVKESTYKLSESFLQKHFKLKAPNVDASTSVGVENSVICNDGRNVKDERRFPTDKMTETEENQERRSKSSIQVEMCPNFKIGEKVRVISDEEKVKFLQSRRIGWDNDIVNCLGKFGKIRKIDSDGDVAVAIDSEVYIFNAECLLPDKEAKVNDQITNKTESVLESDRKPTQPDSGNHETFKSGTKIERSSSPSVVDRRSRLDHSTSNIKVGNRVCVDQPVEYLKEIQRKHGGWRTLMSQCIGETMSVTKLMGDSEVEVDHKGSKWIFYKGAVRKIFSFNVGDIVKVIDDEKTLQLLQQNHGGWDDDMKETLDKVGRVEAIDSDGDVAVAFGQSSWVFNPGCLVPALGASINELDTNKKDSSPSTGSATGNIEPNLGRLMAHLLLLDTFVRDRVSVGPKHIVVNAARGNVINVTKILQMKRELVNATFQNITPLMVASQQGHLEIVKILIENGAKIETKDKKGNTALLLAIAGKAEGVAVYLVQSGADVNIVGAGGMTTAHLSAYYGMCNILKVVLDKGCSPNNQDEDGDTPLHYAIKNGKDEAISLILGHTNINLRLGNKKGFNPLQLAGLKGHDFAVRQILTKPENLQLVDLKNADGFTALHIAAINNHCETARLLLAKGNATVDIENAKSLTPLHLAASRGHRDMVKLLIEKGASVNVQDNEGDTPLHVGLIVCLRNPNDTGADDNVPLNDVILKENDEVISLILSHPNINLRLANQKGFNCLQYAVLKGHNFAVEQILTRHENLQLVDLKKADGFTALHIAALNNHYEIAEILVVKGRATVDIQNCQGSTPLHLAASREHTHMVNTLMENGASVNVKNSDGDTPLHILLRGRLSNPDDIFLDLLGIPRRDNGQEYNARLKIACSMIDRGANTQVTNNRGATPLQVCRNVELRSAVQSYAQTMYAIQKMLSLPCMRCIQMLSDSRLQPCNHKVLCQSCSMRVNRCPLCEKPVTSRTDLSGNPIVKERCKIQ